MPNRWTFTILPIKVLLKRVNEDYSLWVDPFAGQHSPAGITNDLNPEANSIHHLCALEFLREIRDESVPGVLYDPPYSFYQAKTAYEGIGKKNLSGSMRYWKDVKDQTARIIQPGGMCISFGWNSNGLGKGRGFEIKEILLIAHGGSKNDTIVTIETKTKEKS